MRIAIIGAGLAGTSLAHGFLQTQQAVQITLFDSADPMTASLGQTLLYHPFPGRSFAPHPFLAAAVEQSNAFLEYWRRYYPTLIRPIEMWRPLKGSNAHRLSQSHTDWWTTQGKNAHLNSWRTNPPSFAPVNAEDLVDIPSFKTAYETLKTGPAYAIDAMDLFPQIHQQLEKSGVRIQKTTVQRLQQHSGNSEEIQWAVQTNDSVNCFEVVILALGRSTQSWFPNLDITVQGGSLLRATPKAPAEAKSLPALSLDGLHIGQHHSGDWVFGATRWSKAPQSPEMEIHDLEQKLRRTLPCSPQFETSTATIWSGIRSIYGADRMPLCGELPQHPNVFVLSALGSKGWLWGPWSAALLVERILNPEANTTTCEAFSHIDLMRANAEDGWYSPFIHHTNKN